jgi:hypothetical protein
MPPKEEMMDSFEKDIISFQVDPRKHPRIGIALIPFNERYEKEVEEFGEEDESDLLIPDVIDDGDDYEEFEAGTTTIYASRMNGTCSDEDLIMGVEELPPESTLV